MRHHHRYSLAMVMTLAVGCANDPVYLPSPTSIDAGEMMHRAASMSSRY